MAYFRKVCPAFPAINTRQAQVNFVAYFYGITRVDDCFEGVVEKFDEDTVHFVVENNGAKFPAELIFP